ncbi:hypothetical protein SeLEV6574_g02358 [Synchytrium endobioticum]|nr:hypothetical protein SeLEV6574_g08113 [Synchytrium endobioticum]TPX47935.1 hypothetical protein SeLEV6574_g02358 [Synchytrium endobioticum]
MIKHQDFELLRPALDMVALKLREHHHLEWQYRNHIQQFCPREHRPDLWRVLVLPDYDWERLRNNLPPLVRNDPDIAALTRDMWKRVTGAIVHRQRAIRGPFPVKLPSQEMMKSFIDANIEEIVLHSIPATTPFKEHLWKQPDEAMPKLQMMFTSVYHRLVYEKLKTLFQKIKNNMDVPKTRGIYEPALAEVERVIRKHHSLEGQYREVCERMFGDTINWPELEPLECGGAGLECTYVLESTAEAQTPTSHDEPISDNPPGFSVGPSTSQPGPCLLDAVTHGGGVDDQPPSVGVHDDQMQPGFPGISDTTVDATPDPSLRFRYSLDDRVRLSHGGVGNELRRPPCDHVGFVGGSSTALERSTDSVRRKSDSSLHGHETVDSDRSPRRVKVFGVFLG